MIANDGSMRCDVLVFFGCAMIFCINFARWLQKIEATCRPRNARFKDVHTGTKRCVSVKTSNRDSGISGSGNMQTPKSQIWRCFIRHETPFGRQTEQSGFGDFGICQHVLIFWDAMIFCNNFSRWLQKIVATCRARNPQFLMPPFIQKTGFRARMNKIKSRIPCSGNMCWFLGCVGFLRCMIFCNNFARWLQKIVRTSQMRCVGFSGMLRSFVTTLQDDYKR